MSNYLNSRQWTYKYLSPKEMILGNIYRSVNNIILTYQQQKGTEDMATQITNNLWLGNCQAAQNSNFLAENNIHTIINVSNIHLHEYLFVDYKTFIIRDKDACQENLLPLMESAANVINEAITQNKIVLVNCKRGHHRSASIVVLYLMKYHNYSLEEALVMVKRIRPTSFRRMTCMLETLINYEYQHILNQLY